MQLITNIWWLFHVIFLHGSNFVDAFSLHNTKVQLTSCGPCYDLDLNKVRTKKVRKFGKKKVLSSFEVVNSMIGSILTFEKDL